MWTQCFRPPRTPGEATRLSVLLLCIFGAFRNRTADLSTMSSYNTKGVVNRYWKRPKPRVYDCNIRDVERFYNQSYKDYLEAKEAAAKRDAGSRLIDDAAGKWRVQRSNSLLDSMTDSLLDSSTRSNTLNSSLSSWQNGEASSGASKYRAASLSKAASKEMDDDGSYFEERIQRVQKLRSELGLPTEIGGGSGGGRVTSKVTFDLPSETTTSNFTMRRVSSPDPRGVKGRSLDNSSESSSFTSTRSSGRYREADLTSDSFGDVRSTATERRAKYSSKFNSTDDSSNLVNGKSALNGGTSFSLDNDAEKYSCPKSSLKSSRKFDMDDDSFSSKPSEPSSSFKSSRKVTTITASDADECDADAFLSNIRKKFPTSDEIMERIKKMDSEI